MSERENTSLVGLYIQNLLFLFNIYCSNAPLIIWMIYDSAPAACDMKNMDYTIGQRE